VWGLGLQPSPSGEDLRSDGDVDLGGEDRLVIRPESLRALPSEDFRAARAYLADDVFLSVPGGGSPPTDPIDEEHWAGLTRLPTDVLLRTTDYQGRMVADTYDQSAAWIHASPHVLTASDFMFEPALDASDEFHAAPFIAVHGHYRQAVAGLRNALEGMTVAAAFAVRNDQARYVDWRAGTHEPKFGNACDILAHHATLAAADGRIGGPGLVGPAGVVRTLYGNLCRYAHSRAGHTNFAIWQSNGPVWIQGGFTKFWIDYCDTIAACYVLLKIGWAPLELPEVARPLYDATGPNWLGLGAATEREFFPA